MVLDIVLFRKDQGGDPDLVIESQRRRGKGPETVQAVIDADNKWRKGLKAYSNNIN
jgi:seryl-tRNA synthetase